MRTTDDTGELVGERRRGDSPANDESDAVPEIEATELKKRLDKREAVVILDVREPHEWEIANLGEFGAHLIPLGELADRAGELDRTRDIVVYCRSGKRSAKGVRQLRDAGFERVRNLSGGILAWSDEIDPRLPKY